MASPHLPSYLSADGESTLLEVRVVVRAGRTALAGERGGALAIRVAAAPVDGAANGALIAYLAKCLDVAPSAITLVAGDRSRSKRLRIAGLDAARVARRIAGP